MLNQFVALFFLGTHEGRTLYQVVSHDGRNEQVVHHLPRSGSHRHRRALAVLGFCPKTSGHHLAANVGLCRERPRTGTPSGSLKRYVDKIPNLKERMRGPVKVETLYIKQNIAVKSQIYKKSFIQMRP